ncbi:MAG: hypothetical protein K1060chlam2_00581 [Chlamydiae bacterium]|nr:hypothetical protein [Chlamydiota bacterium]
MRILGLLLLLSTSLFGKCCSQGGVFSENQEPTFLAFVSFSMPQELWIQMSRELEQIGGTFVLRGMPNNSFQNFLTHVMELRERGVHAPIGIDPDSFEKYKITAVPTFVLLKKDGFEKTIGNVSVTYALEKMEG